MNRVASVDRSLDARQPVERECESLTGSDRIHVVASQPRHVASVGFHISTLEGGIGADVTDHKVDQTALIKGDFVGTDPLDVSAMETTRMGVYVGKHIALMDRGDALLALPGHVLWPCHGTGAVLTGTVKHSVLVHQFLLRRVVDTNRCFLRLRTRSQR